MLFWQNVETVFRNNCRGRLSNEALIGASKERKTRCSLGSTSGLLVEPSDSTLATLGPGRGPGVRYAEMLISGRSVFPSLSLCAVNSPLKPNEIKFQIIKFIYSQTRSSVPVANELMNS